MKAKFMLNVSIKATENAAQEMRHWKMWDEKNVLLEMREWRLWKAKMYFCVL